jgi:hypothetical protein
LRDKRWPVRGRAEEGYQQVTGSLHISTSNQTMPNPVPAAALIAWKHVKEYSYLLYRSGTHLDNWFAGIIVVAAVRAHEYVNIHVVHSSSKGFSNAPGKTPQNMERGVRSKS